MKKDCSTCEHMGKDCPKMLMMLPLNALIDWCLFVMAQNKITHEQVARLSGVPKGTIDRVLSKQSEDCRYSTIHAIVRALVAYLGITAICLDEVAAGVAQEATEQERRIEELQQALDRSEQILQSTRDRLELINEQRGFLREQIVELGATNKAQRRTIRVLTALLGVAVAAVLGFILWVV